VQRFHFALAKVLDFRRRQLELEEAKFDALHAERRVLASESSRLEGEALHTRQSLMVTGFAESQDLVAADLYLRHLSAETRRHASRVAEWQTRASKQQQAVVEARRRVRLIEKLEERRLREWKAAVDREQENLASELYLARWKR
jgi:flagellar export protein FliJ